MIYEDYKYAHDSGHWRYGVKKVGPFWNKKDKLILELETCRRHWDDPSYGNGGMGDWEHFSTWREMTLADAHNLNLLELYYSVYGKE